MTAAPAIRLETTKRLSAEQELALVAATYARSPGPGPIRERLAWLNNRQEAYGDTVSLLDGAVALNFREALMLASALLAVAGDAAAERALDAAGQALDLAETHVDRARALAETGRAQARLRRPDASATLARALELDPHNRDACRRLAALHTAAGDHRKVVALTERLLSWGAGHSELFAIRTIALTRIGEVGAARELAGFQQFHLRRKLGAPSDWRSDDDYHAALAAELLAHPGLYLQRNYGGAGPPTWRIDTVASRSAPLAVGLLERLVPEIGRHLDARGAADHPWMRALPRDLVVHSWCVVTKAEGYETWHIHEAGWMSGVYYVSVPAAVCTANDGRGHIAFGVPDELVGAAAAQDFGRTLVRPEPGLLVLFPAHTYHRTFPHGADEPRICLSFDLWPG